MSKTLLRRHLSMRFQELIGHDLQNHKNQYEKSANCQPLTLHTKIKVITTNQFDQKSLIS